MSTVADGHVGRQTTQTTPGPRGTQLLLHIFLKTEWNLCVKRLARVIETGRASPGHEYIYLRRAMRHG